MTEKQKANELMIRFQLVKNENLEYIMDKHATLAACLIAVKQLQELSTISASPYYSVEYWDKVTAILKSQIHIGVD